MIKDLFKGQRVLIAVAHNDDVEFIMGGTISYLKEMTKNGDIEFVVMTFASREPNTKEPFATTLSHQKDSFNVLDLEPIHIENHEFRARFLPNYEDDIRLLMKDIRQKFNPSIVITHYKNDPNQDHVSVYEQVRRVFNDRTILGGEIANTGDRLQPNFFIGLTKEHIYDKYKALQCYQAENHKFYFQQDLIEALARTRGGHAGCFEYAEAFELYKLQTGTGER